jgi:hypothetical protein
MPRGKARPLKQVFQSALEVAKAFGFARVEVFIPDGSTVVFSQEEGEQPPQGGAAEHNDFDLIIKRRKNLRNEEKP